MAYIQGVHGTVTGKDQPLHHTTCVVDDVSNNVQGQQDVRGYDNKAESAYTKGRGVHKKGGHQDGIPNN